jgi:hypothetical protein
MFLDGVMDYVFSGILSSKLSEYSSKTLITMWMSDAVTIAAFS